MIAIDTKQKGSPLEVRSLQSSISYRYGICKSTVSQIFSGKKRATLTQAAQMEEYFTRHGIPLNRWDLLYGVQRGQALAEYLERKTNEEMMEVVE